MSNAGVIPPSVREVDAEIKKAINKERKRIKRILQYAGEAGINEARTSGDYTDRTGNLRSSTGYAVAEGGKVGKVGNFESVANGEEGTAEGRAFAREVAERSTADFTLSLVAGKEYASYVAAKGINVLDSGVNVAKQTIQQLWKVKNDD